MKDLFKIILGPWIIFLTAAAGLYVGAWLLGYQGLVSVADAIKTDPTNRSLLANGIIRLMFLFPVMFLFFGTGIKIAQLLLQDNSRRKIENRERIKDKIKKFEVFILRPIQLTLISSAIAFAINRLWFLLVANIIGLFYLGIIGSKIHPLQSAFDLVKGPLTNPAAKKEARAIPSDLSNILVSHACTRVGILLGFGTGIISFSIYRKSWLLCVIFGAVVTVAMVLFLKLIFDYPIERIRKGQSE